MVFSLVLLGFIGFLAETPKPIAVTVVRRATPVSYAKEIAEILDAKCVGCHSAVLSENKLILEDVAAILKGGKHGPAIVAGKANESLLFTMAAHRVEPVMPPKDKKDLVPLTPEELGLLKQWIDAGAQDDTATVSLPAKSVEMGTLPPGVHPINAVDLTGDGRRVAAGRANLVEVYDVDSGIEIIRLGGHKDLIQSLRFSADARRLAAGSYQIVTVWNAPTGTLDKTLSGSPEPIKALIAFRDGKTLITASAEKAIRFWNTADGKMFRSVSLPSGVDVLALSPDEKTLATGAADGTIRLFDIVDGKEQALLKGHSDPITLLHYAPDDKTLISSGVDGPALVWNLSVKPGESPTSRSVVLGPKKSVHATVLSRDGKTLLVASYDSTIRQIDLAEGKTMRSFTGAAGPVLTLAISPDGQSLVSGSADRSARIHELASGRLLATFGPLAGPIQTVAFAPSGNRILTGGSDGGVKVWDVATGRGLIAFGPPAAKAGVALSPIRTAIFLDDGRMATAADKLAWTWTYQGSWTEEKTLGPHVFRVLAIDFSPDGKLIATGGGEPSRSGEVKVWDVATGNLIRSLDTLHSDTVFALRFSPDGTKLATVAADKFLKVINVADGKELKSFEGHTNHVLAVDWKSDGKQLVTAGADNVIKVWDFESGEGLRTLNPTVKQITALRWVPGKSMVVGTSGDPSVRVWNPDNGTIARTFEGASDYLFAVATSVDGGRIAAGGADGVLLLWNGVNGQPIRKIAPAKDALAPAQGHEQ